MNFEMTQGIDKGHFEEFTASSLKPSNILGIRVDRISEKDEVQRDFFEICSPNKLDSFIIKLHWQVSKVIMDFYSDPKAKIVNHKCKEMYLCGIDVKDKELEQIVKAAANIEEFSLWLCNIHCSRTLNFNISDEYKTNTMNFNECKFISESEGKLESFSSLTFKNIVKSFSKWGLKTSLKKFNISCLKSFFKDELQLLFNKYEMNHVLINEDTIKYIENQ